MTLPLLGNELRITDTYKGPILHHLYWKPNRMTLNQMKPEADLNLSSFENCNNK
jgi:hypothetical protein